MHLQSFPGAIFGDAERPKAVLLAFLLLCCPLGMARVSAQNPVAAPDEDVTARIALIQQALDAGQGAANRWWCGWLAAYAGGTVAQAAIGVGSTDEQQRQDMLVGGTTSAL